LSASVKGI